MSDAGRENRERYLAHSINKLGLVEPLSEHLKRVALRSGVFAAPFGAEREGRAAGILHDLGKYRAEFQELLAGNREKSAETHHAIYGAAMAQARGWFSASFSIAGHHAGLHDRNQWQTMFDDPAYDAPTRAKSLLPLLEIETGPLPDGTLSPAFLGENPHRAEFYTRMLFSCLVDADCLETEAFYAGKQRNPLLLIDHVDALLKRLVDERDRKSREGPVNAVRHEIFDRCLAAAANPPGFFSLTVPTGGGKTLSAMAFALAHAKKWNLDRVIVVIPYLSIIEQNAAEYRRILDPENNGLVIEHHSAAPESEKGEGEERTTLDRAAENWDAPLVVTTSVQFVESLFASSPSKCRKLHNVCRSVVVFDEAQTLPYRLLSPLLDVLRSLKENYHPFSLR